MIQFLCFVIVITILTTPIGAIDCNHNRCTNTVHTLCKYPSDKPAAACGNVMSVGFTDSEKNEMLKAHNDYRAYVAAGKETRGNPGPQPAATNMKTMVWNDDLAYVAQRWAMQCSFGHDECRNDDKIGYVGQNAAMTMTTGTVNTKPSDIVKMWYEEVTKFDRNQVNKLTNINNVGHYTQLVSANSNNLGCGKIVYQTDPKGWKYYYVVCNYGPGGNFINSPIYQAKN